MGVSCNKPLSTTNLGSQVWANFKLSKNISFTEDLSFFSLRKKQSFPLRISSVNVTKYAVPCKEGSNHQLPNLSTLVTSKSLWHLRNDFTIRCAILSHLYNLKNVRKTHGRVLLLLKETLVHGCCSRFLSCTNDTKSRKASHCLWIAFFR